MLKTKKEQGALADLAHFSRRILKDCVAGIHRLWTASGYFAKGTVACLWQAGLAGNHAPIENASLPGNKNLPIGKLSGFDTGA